MKAWALATTLLAFGAAAVAAALIGIRVQANAEGTTQALVLVERDKTTLPAQRSRVPAPVVALTRETPIAAESVPQAAATSPAAASTLAIDEAPLTFRKTSTYNGAPVYVPDGCQGPYDVILHFHGAHPYVKDLLEKSRIRAVLAVLNAGNGSEKYAQAYQAGGALNSLLRQIETTVAPLCAGEDAKPRRVALMAWSAGYAAVEKLLSRPEDRERVDAALLADGLHAGFTDPWRRTFAPRALQPFRDFGELAKQGKRLLAITHSSILTDGYGSTTECSRFLLKSLQVPCDNALASGTSANFSIQGFTGDDKAAHIAQFRRMDTTLLPKLRERWQP